ncbi:MAG: Anaphase-promoting complex subunit 23 [Chaenotheca gracillima]|nr:MAG: Anaphase-promoting complex subunit 23 [Chaenotheca gracillima]
MPSITRGEFEGVFPKLVDELVDHARQYGLPQQALDWYKRNLEYNSMGGKYNRGMTVVDTSSLLLGRQLTETEHFQSATLGWCVELLQAMFLVSDDIMDESKTRRGQPCWYLQPEVGMVAINDAFLLESAIFQLLKSHFRTHPAYIDLVELFHEVALKTEFGQQCDLLTAPENHVDLNNFSIAKYTFIVIYKTAYYSFYLPVALSLHQLGLATPANLAVAHKILIPLGEYFQVQDDYLDNFGAPEVIGKIGTDIQDNKCSWLVNKALEKATPAQREVLETNYGIKNKDNEAKVKALFNEMKLDDVYRQFEDEKVAEIRARIAEVDESAGLKRSVFEGFLQKIYKRKS